MSSDETDLIERLHAVARGFEMPAAPPGDDVHRGRRRVRRTRALVAGAAAAVVVVVLGVSAALGGQDRSGSRGMEPVERPGLVVGAVPVWYDESGLHRGDVVEQTPVDLVQPEHVVGPDQVAPQRGALALVRSGAVYLDPATGDVWFHPWGGHPRVVGHDSKSGPGGDPNGDTAAWFDAGLGKLVVYDTAAGRVISRTPEYASVGDLGGDHWPAGNGFLQVSAERVVWAAEGTIYSHDVRTGRTSAIQDASASRYLMDLHDQVEVFRERGTASALVLSVPGRSEERYPDLEARARLSASGNHLLSVEGTETRHAAAIVDTRTGELWRLPNAYPSIAWSYSEIALVDVQHALLACDAPRHSCRSLPAERPFLMPTN